MNEWNQNELSIHKHYYLRFVSHLFKGSMEIFTIITKNVHIIYSFYYLELFGL